MKLVPAKGAGRKAKVYGQATRTLYSFTPNKPLEVDDADGKFLVESGAWKIERNIPKKSQPIEAIKKGS